MQLLATSEPVSHTCVYYQALAWENHFLVPSSEFPLTNMVCWDFKNLLCLLGNFNN